MMPYGHARRKRVNERRVCNESIGPLVDPGSNLVSDDAGMATLLNNHFASVITVENTDELPRLDAAQADAADHAGATLDTVQFTPAIVEEKLGEHEVHNTVGPDNMHLRVLKELKGCLLPALLTFSLGQCQLRRFRMTGRLLTWQGSTRKLGVRSAAIID